jgi:endonuclease/exonuclease/phosphatase family metal-dependent hydrolase
MLQGTRALGVATLMVTSVLGCSTADDTSSSATDSVAVTAESTMPSTDSTVAAQTTPATEAPPTTPEPAQPEPSSTAEPSPARFRIATFNTGLAEGYVPLASERLPLVAEAIADLDADVVFLQEVWASEAAAEIREATSTSFPEAVFPEPVPDTEMGTPACTAEGLADLEACIAANCGDASADELVDCVLSNCGAQFGGLDEQCQSCIAANVGKTVEEAVASCTAGSSTFAYGGSVGLGLLSKLPIVDTDVFVLDSSLNRRAVLHALVDAGDLGQIHIFGTHLSAVFSDVPYPGDGTWEQEQAAQIEDLLAYIDTRVEPADPIVLLGDFNTGPAGELFSAEVPANYEVLVQAVDTNTYVETDGARCTFCGDNPLLGDDTAVVIDHVFTRGIDAALEANRILDEPLEIDVDGDDVTTTLSDHYGVLLVLTGPSGG